MRNGLSVGSVPRCYKREKLEAAVSQSAKLSEVKSIWLVSQMKNRFGSAVESCCCEKLLVEAGDSSGTHSRGNVCHWKPLPSNV
jgi:hypothetical protein